MAPSPGGAAAPRLAPPTMPVAALAPDAPPADTIRAYAATVMTLKGAVTERDAIIAGCAAPTGANSAGGSGVQATAAVGNAAAGAQAASGAPGLQNNGRQAGRMKWLHDALTGKGNLTFDAARILGVIGAVANVGLWAAAGT